MDEIDGVLRALLSPAVADAGRRVPMSDADWVALVQRTPAPVHPWLAAHVRERCSGGPPQPERAVLETAARSAAMNELHRRVLLGRVVTALERAGVPFAVVKGAALAHTVYPHPSLRSMDDVDLWTQPEYFARAVAALGEAGLREVSTAVCRAAAEDAAADTTQIFEFGRSPLRLELHCELTSLSAMSPAWIRTAWQRREPRRLGGVTASVLHPDDTLTHLIAHARKHHLECGLRALMDIALVIDREGERLNWPALVEVWRRERLEIWALVVLSLAAEIAGAPVPDAILARRRAVDGFDEMSALAHAHVFDAQRTLPGVERLLTARGRAAWLLHRTTTWYWKGPAGLRRSPANVIRDAAVRMRRDVGSRLPVYVRGLFDGRLRGAELADTRARLDRRRRLHEMMANAEVDR